MTPTLDRRNVLKALGGVAGVGVVGGVGLSALAGPAAANSFTIDPTSVTTNDGELAYVAVDVGGNLVWSGFDVPAERLRFVSKVAVPDEGLGPKVLNDSVSDTFDNWSGDGDSNGWGGDGEYVESLSDPGGGAGRQGEVVTDAQWVIISDGTQDPAGYRTTFTEGSPPDWTDTFDAPDDDGDGQVNTKVTTVEKTSEVYFLDANGNELTEIPSDLQPISDTAAFDVTVNNEPADTSGTTDGTSTSG